MEEKTEKHQLDEYLDMGRSYRRSHQFEQAIEKFQQALKLAEKLKDGMREAKTNSMLGRAYKLNNQIQTAIEYYKKALEIAKERGYKEQETRAYLGLGHAYRLDNQIQKATEYYEKVLEIALEWGYKEKETIVYLGLGHVYILNSQIPNAIQYYKKALDIAKEWKYKEQETKAYLVLGRAYRMNNQIQRAVEYYEKSLEIAKEKKYKENETRAYVGLGAAYMFNNRIQKAMEYYKNALKIAKERRYKEQETKAYLGLGHAYRLNNQIQKAMEYYEKALEIAQERKYKEQETIAYLGLGRTYRLNSQIQKAMQYYEIALDIARQRGYKEQEIIAYIGLGKAYSLNNQIEIAMKYYEKTLEMVKEPGYNYKEHESRAYLGFGHAYKLKNQIPKAMEYYDKALAIAGEWEYKEQETIAYLRFGDAHVINNQIPEAKEYYEKALEIATEQRYQDLARNAINELLKLTDVRERAEALMEEACNLSKAEEDLVLIPKYKEISRSYVYSRNISTKEPFTENVRKAMTDDVKELAYKNLLVANDQEPGTNEGEFSKKDEQIFNFAKSEVFKNASTQKPAFLNTHLVSCMNSIGQITCGKVHGTCFLVADAWVITNYHVYRMIKDERTELGNPTLPIMVRFGYFHSNQTEHIDTVEVDEAQDITPGNYKFDYKFFRLKQSECLTDRVPLGAIVRNWQLSDGRIVILGHPEGKEMQEEVCVVLGCNAWFDTMKKRNIESTGVHMTNADLMSAKKYSDSLPYDTSFFCGSSGSPVFAMSGNIVAMHTQGYLVERSEENIPDQQDNNQNEEQDSIPNQQQKQHVLDQGQENIPNQEQENTSKRKKYSLMEFGVQFISICENLKELYNENVVKYFFPNYKLNPGEEPMEH